jgi:hypothetical protein
MGMIFNCHVAGSALEKTFFPNREPLLPASGIKPNRSIDH